MNCDKDLPQKLEQTFKDLGYEILGINFSNDLLEYYPEIPLKDCNELRIIGVNVWETIKLPKKKKVTVKYVLKKFNKEKIYKSFAPKFEKLLRSQFPQWKNTFNVYPTTYGIGVSVFFNNEQNDMVTTIGKVLDTYGIAHTNEYSNARYVYRFKLSKSKENVKRMEALC